MSSLEEIKIVCLGGGTGLSTLLSGLKYVSLHAPFPVHGHSLTLKNLTGIVTVSDDGGSSGRLRDQYQTPAPGDIRNCLVALASDESLMTQLFRYRFSGTGELHNHSLGNLLLTALTDITGDFAQAVRLSSQVLAVEGQILPSTSGNVALKAILQDGSEVTGETRITAARQPIRQVLLEPSACCPLPEAIEAILNSDIVTIGPGSLFTSLIPNLLVEGVLEAIEESRAVKIYIGNLMTQPNETIGFSFSDHLRILKEHSRGSLPFDHVLMNVQPIPPGMILKYREEGAKPVENDCEEIRRMGVAIHTSSLLGEGVFARHHSVKLAEAVLEIFEKEKDNERASPRPPGR
jgi:uncharacterized cofD-like protein